MYTRIVLAVLLVLSCNTFAAEVDAELKERLKQAAGSSSFEDSYAAQVWLVDMSNRIQRFVPDQDRRIQLLTLIHQEANRAQIAPELVISVIHIESLFDRYAISRAGALGLMQIMPFWTNEIGRSDDNLFNIATNLRYGCTILAHYLEKEKGDLQSALARYNGSYGKTWYPEKVLLTWERRYFIDNG